MTIETKGLVRTFRYNSVDLPDPGQQYTIEQVRDFYAATYPEIVSAAVEGPEEKDGKLQYTFRRAVGTKGLRDGCALVRTVDGHKVKRCAGCQTDRALSLFTHGSGPGGLHRHCRDCQRAYRRGGLPAMHARREGAMDAQR